MNRSLLLPLVALVFVAGACGAYHAYEGPTRPESELSVITLGSGVGFVRIGEDGDPGVRSAVYLVPGEHTISVRYESYQSCWLNPTTRAGVRYVAQGSSRAGGFVIELLDTSTGAVVATCGSL